MEIERKFLLPFLPRDTEKMPFKVIEQAYLCTEPVIRVRREDNEYYLTYKGSGLLAREEHNLPLTKEAYEHLLPKGDGNRISKKRYLFPLEEGLTAEVDIFSGIFTGLLLAEVEFPDMEKAASFVPPSWFGPEVTYDGRFHNSTLSRLTQKEITQLLTCAGSLY